MRPGSLDPRWQLYFVALVALSLLISLLFWYLRKQNKKSAYNRIWKRLQALNVTNFFIGLAFLFFTYETIPLLSARFWFLLWGAGILVWLFFIVRSARQIPKIKEEIARENLYKKYIP